MTEAEDEAHRYPACPHIEDHRLQDIADAWREYRKREAEPWLREEVEAISGVIALLDALCSESKGISEDALKGTDNETL